MKTTIHNLLPHGVLRPKEGSVLYKLLQVCANALQEVKDDIAQTASENNPLTARFFVKEWNELMRTSSKETAHTYLTAIGGQNIDYIKAQLRQINPSVDIDEVLGDTTRCGHTTSRYGHESAECGGGVYVDVIYPFAFTDEFDIIKNSELFETSAYYILFQWQVDKPSATRQVLYLKYQRAK